MGIFKRLRRKVEQAKENYRACHLGRHECYVFTRGNIKKDVKEDVKVYHLAGNDWYAVLEDDDKIMLVDTDCKIGDEELKTPWSDGDWLNEDGENGQCILNYCNNLVDTYFDDIRHAIMPTTVGTGIGKVMNAWMWPISHEMFLIKKDIGGKIADNTSNYVWTRSFAGIYNNRRCAWRIDNSSGELSKCGVNSLYRVAPAFYLLKSAIDHITDDGEIILLPADECRIKYRLAGNEWYVIQAGDKILLVDTDCKIGDEELKTPWSDGDCHSEEGKNGQCILNYCNKLADKYFNDIKYAIVPETVFAGTGKLRNAYMWPMSKDEFDVNKVVGSEIVRNTNSAVWTRTFNSIFGGSYRRAWCVNSAIEDLGNYYVGNVFRVAPAFYLRKSAIDHITEDGEIILKLDPLKFVADGNKTYHLAGNDWYAVLEDDDKIMLVDTDCKIGDEELYTPWSDVKDVENGQCILDYVNRFTDTYFSTVKHAIMPRTVEAGTGKIEYAWMWPMSKEEFDNNKAVGSKIVENSNSFVWTRTFGDANNYNNYKLHYAWALGNTNGDLGYTDCVGSLCRVAPAFYLRKSAIDHITEDGKIVLNEGITILKSQYDIDAELQMLREAGMDEAGIRQCQKYIEIFCKDQ